MSASASSSIIQLPSKYLRALYDWVIGFADKPNGMIALFILAFAESSFFPIPPDVLLIALCVGNPQKAFRFALWCSVGSVLGGIFGYAIGLWGYNTVGQWLIDLYHGQPIMDRVKGYYDEWGFWGVLTAAITPIPYKVFTIASGFFQFNFTSFVFASILGRSFRFYLVSLLLYIYGKRIQVFIEKYFNLLASLFMILLITGFFILKYI